MDFAEPEMRHLNYLVEGELGDVKEVVREFRQSKGLAKDKLLSR